MSAVSISGASFPAVVGRLGPFQDGSGNLWVVGFNASNYLTVWKSSDGGETWNVSYPTSGWTALASATSLDAVFDSVNEAIYVISGAQSHIMKFLIGTTTWSQFDSSGTPPTISSDVNIKTVAFLTRRSTGEFVVFYQGPTHSSMGSAYRSVYYARCSAAGVWSAGVEVDAGGQVHYDCKGGCLGASDRVHMLYTLAYPSGGSPALNHRSLDSSNVLDTPTNGWSQNINATYYYSIYYNATLGKIVIDADNKVYRGNSVSTSTISADTNNYGTAEPASCNLAFIYEPTDAKLYAFYRDAASDDIYQNSASGTTWGTPTVQTNGALTAFTNTGLAEVLHGESGGSNEKIGQTFQCLAGSPAGVWLNIVSLAGSPTDKIYAEIRSGSFDGNLLATTEQVTPPSLGWFFLPFSSPPSLSASTTYYLVVRRTGTRDTSNYPRFAIATTGYNLGAEWVLDSGTWQQSVNGDLTFAIGDFPGTLSVTGISVGLITDAIGIVFNDSGVYFDKLVLTAPPEPIPPTTTNEEFFALL